MKSKYIQTNLLLYCQNDGKHLDSNGKFQTPSIFQPYSPIFLSALKAFLLSIFFVLNLSSMSAAQQMDISSPLSPMSINEQNTPSCLQTASSDNSIYKCTFILSTTENTSIVKIRNFSFSYQNETIFTAQEMPGRNVSISNSGYIVLQETNDSTHNITFHFFSPTGVLLSEHSCSNPLVFGFSQSGKLFGIGTTEKFILLSLSDQTLQTYPGCQQFALSPDDAMLAIATQYSLLVFNNTKLIRSFEHNEPYIRKLSIARNNNFLCYISQNRLEAYSIMSGLPICLDTTEEPFSFTDLNISENQILAGFRLWLPADRKYSVGKKVYVLNSPEISQSTNAFCVSRAE